ncbi:MAG: hypothetical protein EOO13_11720 [Chitinophagaceae bacterium]|nr:MAG: hypothetical protein EOO13_11720 [Chitinophagaceae bacterium]
MVPQHVMTTLSSVLDKLKLKGYDTEFRWTPSGFSAKKGSFFQPGELEIIKTYRFEENTDPSDTCIVYLIQVVASGLTGYSLDAYGVYSNHDDEEGYDNFIRMIPERNHEVQLLFEL